MNIKSFFTLLLASSFVLVSCKKDLEPQESSAATETAEVQSTAAPVQQDGQPQMQMQAPQTTMSNTTMPQQQQQQAAPQTVAKGMNPAHGQPGHRCEIPVGAPLNSSPAAGKASTPQMISNDPNTKITPAQVNANGTLTPANSGAPAILNPGTATAAGMNPAHGQPGHRCDIAVGQPLP
jgi:hypothetical protein